jgi:hypothetical protein
MKKEKERRNQSLATVASKYGKYGNSTDAHNNRTVHTENFNVGMETRKEDGHGVIDSGIGIDDQFVFGAGVGLIRHAVNVRAVNVRAVDAVGGWRFEVGGRKVFWTSSSLLFFFVFSCSLVRLIGGYRKSRAI